MHRSQTDALSSPLTGGRIPVYLSEIHPTLASSQVELLGGLPNVERLDSHTVRFVAQDMREVDSFIAFVTGYSPDLAP